MLLLLKIFGVRAEENQNGVFQNVFGTQAHLFLEY